MPFEGHPSETTLHQADSAIVNVSKLQFPLHLRHWHAGDSFQPLGMDGKSQKIQDFFTNHKVSRFEKEKVWLLFNGDGALIWVIGMRMDDRFKIHSKTNKALKINWIK
jgi:tRNA(Ile)-lysidine synthase